MKVAIRADASVQIGSGHAVRCLTLADELRARGAEVLFISRAHQGGARALLEQRGYTCVVLPAPTISDALLGDLAHSAWLGVSMEEDLAQTAAAVQGWAPDWLVVDHYAIDWRWERAMRSHVPRIMVIDDLADRRHDCDLLLDQNFYCDMETRYEGLVPAHCKCLLGPSYALLRAEFAAVSRPHREQGAVKRILLFMGGVDSDNATATVLRGLNDAASAGIAIDVVLGAAAPHLKQVRALCDVTPNVQLHVQIDNMAELMASADLAIGACGSATWERCFLGLPTITIVLADNQRRSAHDLAQAGYIVNLGDVETVTPHAVARAVHAMVEDPAGRAAMSHRVEALASRRGPIAADLICE